MGYASGLESDDFGRSSGKRIPPNAFDDLIDAERETLARAGRRVDKIALIKALREATGLGLKPAKVAVEGYLTREDDLARDRRRIALAWIDDLLDAERAAASKEDRPVTKILLIKTLRSASGLGLKQAREAVEDYLRRRGGEDLPTGPSGRRVASIATVVLIAIGSLVLVLS